MVFVSVVKPGIIDPPVNRHKWKNVREFNNFESICFLNIINLIIDIDGA